MKNVIKTLAGKTVLFIVCILSVCILAGCTIGIVFYTQDDLAFYRTPEQAFVADLAGSELRSSAYSVLQAELHGSAGADDVCDYQILDRDGNAVAQSEGFKDIAREAFSVLIVVWEDENGTEFGNPFSYYSNEISEESEIYTVRLYPKEGTSEAYELNFMAKLVHIAYSLRYAVYPIAFVALLAAVVSFVALMYAAGRRPDTEDFVPGPLHAVPYDLIFAICAIIWIGLFVLADVNCSGWEMVVFGLFLCLILLNFGLGLCMSAASRIKQHSLLKNTVIACVLKLIRKILRGVWSLFVKLHRFNLSLFRGLPMIWRTCLVVGALSFLEFIGIMAAGDNLGKTAVLWLIEKLILVPFILYLALTLNKLRKSSAALADGDLSYHTDTKGMFGDFRRHGENLNSIAGGIAIAVEDRLKSERMKTELITNVSHDIKTPLTSIINYASLIGNEPCENRNITEYSEVLVRQSEKLKRLIEDLVEASKASSGNLEVLLAPCDAGIFLSQANGEYEEKMAAAELTLITKQPEKALKIMADGRRMWRIFDNLMNNICKYAQPGTRVYLSLEEHDGCALISFKNTSREPLDLSEEELTARFTRGDSSRSSEGNGLGLSIAKSMAELQGGSLHLSVDGDLFKAVLAFPLI